MHSLSFTWKDRAIAIDTDIHLLSAPILDQFPTGIKPSCTGHANLFFGTTTVRRRRPETLSPNLHARPFGSRK